MNRKEEENKWSQIAKAAGETVRLMKEGVDAENSGAFGATPFSLELWENSTRNYCKGIGNGCKGINPDPVTP